MGIQDRAIASTVKADLANFAKKMELVRVDSTDELYPARNTLTAAMGFRATKTAYTLNRSNWVYCPAVDRMSYAVGVLDSRGKGYFLTTAGIQENVTYGGSETCAQVGSTGTGSTYFQTGYTWNSGTSAGMWADWMN